MAGIGFALRKLARQDNIVGLAQAYTHSAFAAAGPWLFTLISLGTIITFGSKIVAREYMADFRTIIIYNFSLSLVMSGPVFMISTRYLADCIHGRDVSTIPGMMIGSLVILYVTQLPIVTVFYFSFTSFDTHIAISAIINLLLISTIWVASVFLTAIKDYKSVTIAFASGMLVASVVSLLMAERNSASGLINGLSVGLSVILAVILTRIFAEYPYGMSNPFIFLGHFKKYWEIALGGLIYNIAIWIDKWIMWFAPEAITMRSGLPLYPHYDSAMFYAYLTIVPSMALFIFSIETNFFEHYARFYRDIKNKATYHKIEQNHRAVINSILGSARNFVILQLSICVMCMMMAPKIFEIFRLNYLQIGIFRVGVLGAFFHVMTMFLLILLSYFDHRRGVLIIQFIFLILNGLLTYLLIPYGFQNYGKGYFFASFIIFLIAAFITERYVAKLPYHTFITSNTSIGNKH